MTVFYITYIISYTSILTDAAFGFIDPLIGRILENKATKEKTVL